MSGGRPLPLRVVVLACFLGTGLLAAALGVVWARESAHPRIVLLGSGDGVSVLVASGDARVLIATGSDPAAFAAALESARQPIQRRIDVLLVAGRGDGLLVPAYIGADPHVRMAASLGRLAVRGDAAALADLPALTESRQIILAGEVAILLEATMVPDQGGEASEAWAWRAIVSRGDARVAVLSDGGAAALFPPSPSPALLVVSGREPLAAIAAETGAPAHAVGFADGALSPREMRQAAGSVPAAWAVRVFDGEAIVVPFTEDGVAIPPDAAVPLALPEASTPTP